MRILLVEDDDNIRALIEILLSGEGHIVHSADGVESALEILKDNPSPDMLVTDFSLQSELNGVDLAKKLQYICLGVPVLIVSGHHDLVQDQIGRLPNAFFLAKPFSNRDFLAAVRQAAVTT